MLPLQKPQQGVYCGSWFIAEAYVQAVSSYVKCIDECLCWTWQITLGLYTNHGICDTREVNMVLPLIEHWLLC